MINDRVTRASKQFYVTRVPPVHMGDAQGKMSDSEVAQNSGLNTSLQGKGVWASRGRVSGLAKMAGSLGELMGGMMAGERVCLGVASTSSFLSCDKGQSSWLVSLLGGE